MSRGDAYYRFYKNAPGGEDVEVEVETDELGVDDTISSLVLVTPREVVIEMVALPPASSTLWKISNSPANSSLIFVAEFWTKERENGSTIWTSSHLKVIAYDAFQTKTEHFWTKKGTFWAIARTGAR